MHDQHAYHHEHHHRHPWPFLAKLEQLGDEYLIRKAPWHLPHKWKETIAKILPAIVLIVAIISVPGIFLSLLIVLGVGGFYTESYMLVLLQTVITILIALFYFRSYDRLRRRLYRGWAYVFYAALLGFVSHLLQGSIVGNIIGFLIGMFIIFQVKELYK